MRGVGHRKLVVIVDEGHLLSKEMLEEIRFLLNYKMDSENPLALILAGPAVLVCVDKRLGTGPVNQSRDAG